MPVFPDLSHRFQWVISLVFFRIRDNPS